MNLVYLLISSYIMVYATTDHSTMYNLTGSDTKVALELYSI